jgi:hypothetical protein
MNRAARRCAAAGQRPGRDQGDRDRLHLLRATTRQIEERYQDAKREGDADPVVVFVVDLRDRAGREVARLHPRWGTDSSSGVDRMLADCLAHGEIPTASLALSRPLAVEMLGHFAPRAARQIETKAPPPGYCWVCVVASGGTLTAQFRSESTTQ